LDYHAGVKASELKRLLSKAGATFEQGARHTKVTLRGKVSYIPRHAAKDLGSLADGIVKQLGIAFADLRNPGAKEE
jgi:mRNA interferase HicA